MEEIEGINNVCLIKGAFESIKNDTLLTHEEEKALVNFIDRHVSCDRYNPISAEIANKVNVHRHSRTCHKHGTNCRFNFPRFPSLKTIISVPVRVLEKDEKKRKEIVKKNNDLLNKVKQTLENEDAMKSINSIEQKQFENCKLYQKCVHRLSLMLAEKQQKIVLNKKDFGILKKTLTWNSDIIELSMTDLEVLVESEMKNLVEIHEIEKSILKKRMVALLIKSKINNDIHDDELLLAYENALRVNEKGYSVIIERKTDESFINNFNHEWINAWSANMDLQPSLDFYSVITYISEYYRHV